MDLREHRAENGVVWLESETISAPGGVAHGFSTRLGGVSKGIYSSLNLGHTRGDDPAAVRENYRRFCKATGAGRVEDIV
ncbi:MAG: laccase domain-containing protein, partial [Oscillospiraceae bacterium]|nr:laccase domain-containing protein [Oscillospiraceae bacterium]